MHIYVSFLLKCKIYLHFRDSVGGHLHYATVEFKVQIYICIMLLEIALRDEHCHKGTGFDAGDTVPCHPLTLIRRISNRGSR
jgi:hypothetical protein